MTARVAIDIEEEATTPAGMVATIREYEEGRDREAVEKLDRLCEFGNSTDGSPSILTDLMGDPIARVRHYPSYVALVAEVEEDEMTTGMKKKEIVGVVSGCIKSVSKGSNPKTNLPIYVEVAYILGLRVSLFHRRQGVAKKLVTELEEWCKHRGAQYAYMATDSTNQASINLFTLKCAYTKLRTPTVLVNPVHAHHKPINSRVRIVRLEPRLAEFVYRHRVFANSDFFPKDIDAILSSKLNLGTYMAVSSTQSESDPLSFPPSFAILSVWNTKDVFKLQVKGVTGLSYAVCVGSRVLDTWLPWLRIPSIPDVFRPFGVYFLYGLHVEGSGGPALMRSLCAFVHNMAGDDVGCGAVVAEVDRMDEVKLEWVPHWRRFSWTDLWCTKKLTAADQDECVEDDWVESRPFRTSVFTDPRDF